MRIVSIRGHTFLAGPLGPESVVADLGAHKGEFSREVHQRFGCHCHMVEALPDLFAGLPETETLHKHHLAMAGRDGPVELFVSANPEANSITRTVAGSQAAVTVESATLATLMSHAGLAHIDLLKVDIEGAEIALFESAGADMLAKIAQISVEFHDFVPGMLGPNEVNSVMDKLEESGFYKIKFSRKLNTDVLFINRRLIPVGPLAYRYMKYVAKYLRGVLRRL